MINLEYLLNIIAPHYCMGCDVEGDILCNDCLITMPTLPYERCLLCDKVVNDRYICRQCQISTQIFSIFIRTTYSGIARKLIYVTKFGRVKAGANAIAKAMNAVLPGDYKTVTYVPTTSKRRRQRGYDQAELIAKAIARQRGWKVVSLLRRANDSRQLGASRYQRQKQARASFEVKRLQNETIEPILLIDDVITTGSSVRSCVKLLHEMGFLTVDVAVFAYTQSKQK